VQARERTQIFQTRHVTQNTTHAPTSEALHNRSVPSHVPDPHSDPKPQKSSQRRTPRIPHLPPLLSPSRIPTIELADTTRLHCEPPQTSVLLQRSRRGATAESDVDHLWRIIRKTRQILLCRLLVFRARLLLSLLLTQWTIPPGWGQDPTKTRTGNNTLQSPRH
jgi:hypothetical protein